MKTTLMRSVLVLAVAASGCSRGGAEGPPPLRLGRDVCAACGMMVSEERSACGVVVEKDGEREHAVFDDLGCLFEFERSGEPRVVAVYAKDRGTGAWVESASAWVLVSDKERLRTPMGSGMAVYRDQTRARAGAVEFGGDVVRMDEARARWSGARKQDGQKNP